MRNPIRLTLWPRAAVSCALLFALAAPIQTEGQSPGRVPKWTKEAKLSPGGLFQTPQIREHFLRAWKPQIEELLADAQELPVSDHPILPDDIKDPAFGYLIGMLDRDMSGMVTGDHIQRVVDESGRKSRIPKGTVASLTSVRGDVGDGSGREASWARVSFHGDLRLPVPYSILGYHPGSLVSTCDVIARYWRTRSMAVPNSVKGGPPNLEISDVTMLAFVEGSVGIEVDGWVDKLLGGALDDTYMIGLAVFHYDGGRYAMALGYNEQGEARSGALHMGDDAMRFPTSEELKAIARYLRKQIVAMLMRMEMPVMLPSGK